ncbi:hypothetical protein [Bradyrhizobium sp. HKCCYLRH1062]|uniref:hypothetical protein n=1 Tax=unclassified Bradyrhizobium TaxID=2631580 RepID=UPI003EB8E79F
MKIRNALVISLLLVVVVVFFVVKNTPFVQALLGNWDFVKSVDNERGSYYRLKVRLVYNGDLQSFDIVVACDVRQVNYMDGARTLEVGLTPTVFGRRMADGKAIVVRPPRACRGETTENGGVPVDLLPLIVVFDDAETLAFGTAYLTDDAFDSPLSSLKFDGASIESADKAAFDRFRSEQPNLVSRSSYHTASGPVAVKRFGTTAARIPMGIGCFGYARFRLTDAERQRAAELWPTNRPRYWLPSHPGGRDAFSPTFGELMMTDRQYDKPTASYNLLSQTEYGIADLGMPRRNPVEWSGHQRPVAPSYYPDIGGWQALPWPSDPEARALELLSNGPHVGASIDFRGGATRGFAYCRPMPETFPTGVEYPDPAQAPSVRYLNSPATNYVDGVVVSGERNSRPAAIVERDDFIFRQFLIGLSSTRGDV